MPAEHRNLYVSTTLVIVIFTTIFCGGLTEPMLTQMGMRLDKSAASVEARSPRKRMSITAKDDADRRQGHGSDILRVITGLFNRGASSKDSSQEHGDYEVGKIRLYET